MKITPNFPLDQSAALKAAQKSIAAKLEDIRAIQARVRLGDVAAADALTIGNAALRRIACESWALVFDPLVREAQALVRHALRRSLSDFFRSADRLPSIPTDAESVIPAMLTREFSEDDSVMLRTQADRLMDELARIEAGIFTLHVDGAAYACHEQEN